MNQKVSVKTTGNSKVYELTICGVFIALTFVATYINIRLPIAANGGLVHLGNIPLFIAATYFGKKTGAIVGGIGMALFDLFSGWVAWAPFTLVIVAIMGFVFGLIINKRPTFLKLIVACVVVCLIKVGGYYVAERIIFGNWITPVNSIPGNIVQISVATVISIPIIMGGYQIWGKGGKMNV